MFYPLQAQARARPTSPTTASLAPARGRAPAADTRWARSLGALQPVPYTRRVRLFPIRAPLVALVFLGVTGCSTPAVKVWNLEQLHDGTSRHRYQAALQGDTGWFFRQTLLGAFRSTGAQFVAEKDVEPVEDPAAECLENLIDLEARGQKTGPPDPRHVEWFARLAVEDPARLSRERSVLALGALGQRLPIGLPSRLGADQKPAGPDELAPVLEALVRSVRRAAEGRVPEGGGAPADEIAPACAAVRALDLDLAAGRRALRASTDLERIADSAGVEAPPLDDLVAHLMSLCVRRALAGALADEDEFVRAAAVRGVADTGGPLAIDVVLYVLWRNERASAPLRAVLELLIERGLPVSPPGGPALAHSREDWLESVYTIATQHPEGEMRVLAMRTLTAVSGAGIKSLREEDWYAWWTAREKETPAAAGPGP